MKIPRISPESPSAPRHIIPNAPLTHGASPAMPVPMSRVAPAPNVSSAAPNIIKAVFDGVTGVAVPIIKAIDDNHRLEAAKYASQYLVDAEKFKYEYGSQKTVEELKTLEQTLPGLKQRYIDNIQKPSVRKYFEEMALSTETQLRQAMVEMEHGIRLKQNGEQSTLLASRGDSTAKSQHLVGQVVRLKKEQFPVPETDQYWQRIQSAGASIDLTIQESVQAIEAYNTFLETRKNKDLPVDPISIDLSSPENYKESVKSQIASLRKNLNGNYLNMLPDTKQDHLLNPEKYRPYREQMKLIRELEDRLSDFNKYERQANQGKKELEKYSKGYIEEKKEFEEVDRFTYSEPTTIDVNYYSNKYFEDSFDNLELKDQFLVLDEMALDVANMPNIMLMGGLAGGGNVSVFEAVEIWKTMLYGEYRASAEKELNGIAEATPSELPGFINYTAATEKLYEKDQFGDAAFKPELKLEDRESLGSAIEDAHEAQSSGVYATYNITNEAIRVSPGEVLIDGRVKNLYTGKDYHPLEYVQEIWNESLMTFEHRQKTVNEFTSALQDHLAKNTKLGEKFLSGAYKTLVAMEEREVATFLDELFNTSQDADFMLAHLDILAQATHSQKNPETGELELLIKGDDFAKYKQRAHDIAMTLNNDAIRYSRDFVANVFPGTPAEVAAKIAVSFHEEELTEELRKIMEKNPSAPEVRKALTDHVQSVYGQYFENHVMLKMEKALRPLEAKKHQVAGEEEVYNEALRNLGVLVDKTDQLYFSGTGADLKARLGDQYDKLSLLMGDFIESTGEKSPITGERWVDYNGEKWRMPKTGAVDVINGQLFYVAEITQGTIRPTSKSVYFDMIDVEGNLTYKIMNKSEAEIAAINKTAKKLETRNMGPKLVSLPDGADKIKALTDFKTLTNLATTVKKIGANVNRLVQLENGEIWANVGVSGDEVWQRVEVTNQGLNGTKDKMSMSEFMKRTTWSLYP